MRTNNFDLPDVLYSVSDQDYFGYIIKNMKQ